MKRKQITVLPILAALFWALTTYSSTVYAVSPSTIFYDDLDEDDAMDSKVAIIKDLSAVVLEGHADPAEQRDAKRVMAPLAVQHVPRVHQYSPNDPVWERHYQNMKQVEQRLNQQFKRLCLGTQTAYQPEAIQDLRLSAAARYRIGNRMQEALAFAGVAMGQNGRVLSKAVNPQHCDYHPFQTTLMD